MKNIICVLCFLSFFLIGCDYYSPCNPEPEDYTFTLDKYEAKVGDEIIVNTGSIEVFKTRDFVLYCAGKVGVKDGTEIKEETSEIRMIRGEKISNSQMKFIVPENAITGKLRLEGAKDIWHDLQKECGNSCDAVLYGIGYSNAFLTITQ